MNTIYDHPEYRALLAAVRAAPDDDLPRLVCADWLDEHGEGERAEFIRVQCGLAKNPSCNTTVGYPQDYICDRAKLWKCPRCLPKLRERELFSFANLERWGCHEWQRNCLNRSEFDILPADITSALFTRGFVSTVRGPLVSLVGGECGGGLIDRTGHLNHYGCAQCRGTGRLAGYLPRLVREQAVVTVGVMDREPWHNPDNGQFLWFIHHTTLGTTDGSRIPKTLFDFLQPNRYRVTQNHPTADAAKAALGAACLSWAESEGAA